MAATAITPTGYYGVPVIHKPHWKWLVIGYFFLGGISGAAAAIGGAARAFGGDEGAHMSRVATYVSFVALVPCPPLLILDLGRPARFFNMLRVFRASSPMSVGSWGLAAFGIVASSATALQAARDARMWPPGKFGAWGDTTLGTMALLAGALGSIVAGYSGTLLAATAVPLWSKRPAILGPLFLASAMTSGAAAVSAAAALMGATDDSAHDNLQRFEMTSAVSEGALLVAWLAALGPTARPIVTGHLGAVVRQGTGGAGIAAPLLIGAVSRHLPQRLRCPANLAASALTLLGVLALRYAVMEGGRQSADDAEATFEMTR